MQLKIPQVIWNLSYQFVNVGFFVVIVASYEHVLGELRNFEESFCSHILNSRMLFMHEFIKLLDYSPQKWPVTAEETRELTNNIHYIGSD